MENFCLLKIILDVICKIWQLEMFEIFAGWLQLEITIKKIQLDLVGAESGW